MINEAFTNMPETMEQVMHPSKYLSGESYCEIQSKEIDGWNLEKSDRFGELFITLFLSRHIPIDEARVAAEGWNGDKFTYLKKNDDFLYTWKISWDNIKDANEFTSSLDRTFQLLEAKKIDDQTWEINGNYVSLEIDSLNTTMTSTSNFEFLDNCLFNFCNRHRILLLSTIFYR